MTARMTTEPDKAASYQDVLAEINSCIYWATKFRPVTIKPADPADPKPPAPPAVKPPTPVLETEASGMLVQAETYEKDNPDDSFRVSIRYFEVADRFRGTISGMTAMERCLDRMQRFLGEKQFEDSADKLILPGSDPVLAGDQRRPGPGKGLRAKCIARERRSGRRWKPS